MYFPVLDGWYSTEVGPVMGRGHFLVTGSHVMLLIDQAPQRGRKSLLKIKAGISWPWPSALVSLSYFYRPTHTCTCEQIVALWTHVRRANINGGTYTQTYYWLSSVPKDSVPFSVHAATVTAHPNTTHSWRHSLEFFPWLLAAVMTSHTQHTAEATILNCATL